MKNKKHCAEIDSVCVPGWGVPVWELVLYCHPPTYKNSSASYFPSSSTSSYSSFSFPLFPFYTVPTLLHQDCTSIVCYLLTNFHSILSSAMRSLSMSLSTSVLLSLSLFAVAVTNHCLQRPSLISFTNQRMFSPIIITVFSIFSAPPVISAPPLFFSDQKKK